VEQEIQILHGLQHNNVTEFLGYGSDGKIIKPSGREINDLIYIMMEYVPGGIFFDLC
jgi:serine/threonine protein kinase